MTSRYISSLCLIFFSFICINSYASEQTRYVYESVSSQPTVLVEYASDGLWIIETYLEKADRLPLKTGRWVFPDKVQADRFLLGMGPVWILQPMTEPTSTYRTELLSQTIWTAPEEWDWQWEVRYAAWVRANIDATFFEKYKVATDCADVAIATRWIFARIHGLPVAQTIGGSGRTLFSNESFKPEWANLKRHTDWEKDEVFRKALDYVLDYSYTHTLLRDSYPIAISPVAFLEGTYHLATHATSGHTQLVNEVNSTSTSRLPLYAAASTVPREVRALHTYPFFDSTQPEQASGGFLRFRWAQKVGGTWTMVAPAQMPHYSVEQYEPDFMKDTANFSIAVYKRINPAFDPVLRVKESEATIEQLIRERAQVVEDGFAFCASRDCSPGTLNYENWSTPSRDKRLGSIVTDTESYVRDISYYFPQAVAEWEQFRSKIVLRLGKYDFTMAGLILVWNLNFFDSEPVTPVESRWSLAPDIFAGKAAARVRDLLSARETVVLRNTCSGNLSCLPGTSQFSQNQSFAADLQINEISASILKYCVNNLKAACDDFSLKASQILISTSNEQIPLDRLTEHTVWLNSDPRVSHGVRNGSNGASRQTRVLPGFVESLTESRNGFLLVREMHGGGHLLDQNLATVWTVPLLSSSRDFNLETGDVATAAGEVLTFKDAAGNESMFPIPASDQPLIKWTSGDILIHGTEGTPAELRIYRRMNKGGVVSLDLIDTIRDFHEGYAADFTDGRSAPLLGFMKTGSSGQVTHHYFNLKTGDLRDIPFLPPGTRNDGFRPYVEMNGRVLATISDLNYRSQLGWLGLSDGRFEPLPILVGGSLRFISDDVLLADVVRPDATLEAEVITLRPNGQVKSRFSTGGTTTSEKIRNGHFMVNTEPTQSACHFFNGVTSCFPIPPDRFIYGEAGRFIYLIDMTFALEVVDSKTAKVIFEAPRFVGGDISHIDHPFVMVSPVRTEPWVTYMQIDGDGLPLMTSMFTSKAWVTAVGDENIGRYKALVSGLTNTSAIFRAP